MLLVFAVFLGGCAGQDRALKQGMTFRSELLAAEGCRFLAVVTADYGDELYTFSMECQGDKTGNIAFSLTEPEALSGIQGTISDNGGRITFEDTALYFPLLTDDQLSPASAPWIFLKTLRSGYLTSAGLEEGNLRLTMDDTYEEDALHLDIWMGENRMPVRADILYDGRRILSLEVEGFSFL